MTRLDLIALLGSTAATWPLGAGAQQQSETIPRIGLLTRKTDASVSAELDAFRQALADLGWGRGKEHSHRAPRRGGPSGASFSACAWTCRAQRERYRDSGHASNASRKALELLKEAVPNARRVAMMFDPKNRGMMFRVRALETAAAQLGIE